MTDVIDKELGALEQLGKFIESKLPEVAVFGLQLLLSLIVFWIGTKVIKWICKVLTKFLTDKAIDASVVRFLSSLSKALLYFLLIVTLAMQMGLKEASVVALIGSLGVGLGLALQGGMANLAGGVLILILKPFKLGDYIVETANSQEGTVKRIDMFYTTLTTVDNRSVVIPNAQLTGNSIVNVTAQDKRLLEIKVGVSYNDDIKKVKEIVTKLLDEQPDIMKDQEKNIFVDELADSSVVIGCRAWVPTDKYWTTKWALNEQIKVAFDAAGITIPYNQLEVTVHDTK